MPMNRRELVSMGAVLGGAVLVATTAEGRPVQAAGPAEARGKVTLYGEGSTSYFALSTMPEKVETFHIDPRINERLGRLVLAAAEKGWEIQVTYTRSPDGTAGPVYDVRIKDFRTG